MLLNNVVKLYTNHCRLAGEQMKMALVQNGIEIWRGSSTSELVLAGFVISHEVYQDVVGPFRPVLEMGDLKNPPKFSIEEIADRTSYELMAGQRPALVGAVSELLQSGIPARIIEASLRRKFQRDTLTLQLVIGTIHFLAKRQRPVNTSRFVRQSERDRRIQQGDDFAGDAWLDTHTNLTIWVSVGCEPSPDREPNDHERGLA